MLHGRAWRSLAPPLSSVLQDSIPCVDAENGGVPRMPVALVVPHIYFARQLGDVGGQEGSAPAQAGGAVVSRQVLRDFAGLETVDPDTKQALLDFSYHLACGDTDEAYKSVKGVHSSGVWESMSKMCVKTGRLDVVQKCLGQMSHARAAGALRACGESEPEARLAVVAVHLDPGGSLPAHRRLRAASTQAPALFFVFFFFFFFFLAIPRISISVVPFASPQDMIDDAEQLLKKCKRYDLLNQLYQARGWSARPLPPAPLP